MKLIITEKPSVSKSIASILNAKYLNGYYKNDNFIITNAFGHLYTLANCKDYDEKYIKWSLENYPFIPNNFKYIKIQDKGVINQISLINKIINEYKIKAIINACDSDREGELIFNEILDNLQNRNEIKNIERLWISSHTPKDVLNGLNNLNRDVTGLKNSGYTRQQLDWLIGINHTVCLSLVQNTKLNVGRVLLATLKLIYDRDLEIKNFKENKNYSLKLEFNCSNKKYTGIYLDDNKTKFDTNEKQHLEDIKNSLENGIIKSIKSKETTKSPRKLFNLTDLQGYISTTYNNFNAGKVLKVCQGLYEKKFITYPRTSSRVLDNSQIEEVKKVFKNIMNLELYKKYKTEFKEDKNIFNSELVDSHPAIIPTYIIPNLSELTEEEEIIYKEISKCLIAQFMDKAKYLESELITEVNNYKFISKSKTLIEEGFTLLYANKEENKEEDINTINLNEFLENEKVSISKKDIVKIKSKPKKQFTEETLLKAMENCGKHVKESDEDLKQILSGYSIGTPSTRAETINKLINLKYVEKKKKNILITDTGTELINIYPIKKLLDSNFTGSIEKKLKDIENNNLDTNKFFEEMKQFVIESTNEIKSTIKSDKFTYKNSKEFIGICPKCNKNIYENKKSFYCEGYKDGCKFSLFKEDKFFMVRGKTITSKIAKELLIKKQTKLSFISKSRKKCNVIIYVDFDGSYPKYNLEFI